MKDFNTELRSAVSNGKLVLPNGGRYEGEIIDGEPNGKGVVKFDNGETHEGMFKDGIPNGKGKNSWANGMYIEADFKDGEPVGAGKCKVIYSGGEMPEGSYYEGECLDLQPHGWGRKVMPGWSDREGEWRNGEPHGYSVNKVSDTFAAKAGAQSGWTGEGVVIQGAQRNWWIRTGNGKTEMLRASDNNFDIPQEDLPLSLKARLFLGFVEMYRSMKNKLEAQINELVRKDQEIVDKINSNSASVNQLTQAVTSYDREILEAEYGSDEEDMASFYGSLTERNLESQKIELDALRNQHEQIISQHYELNRKCDLMENLLSQPIGVKSEAYYDSLLADLEKAKSAEDYAALVKKFSNISEYRDCAALAEKCNRKGGHYEY